MAFLQPGVVDGGDGGAVDRGDDWTPTGADATGDVDDTNDEVKDEPKVEKVAKTEKVEKVEKVEKTEEADDTEEETEEETAAEDKPKKKDGRIPLSRHKEILEKERATRATLEAQLKQFQQGGKVADLNADITAAETEVLKLEGEYAKLLTDGETEKAVAVMSKIRKIERDMTDAKADMKTQAAVSLAVENTRYGVALERIEAAFPQLNPDHDDYDEDLMTDVADLKVTYQRRGMTPTDALQKAVKKLVGTETSKQEAATEVKPQVAAKDVAAERKKAAVEKALDGAKKTPPSTKDVGMDSDKAGGTISAKDVMKMSYKDFSALPEETLARMRGDML
jgi:hypothetical protein